MKNRIWKQMQKVGIVTVLTGVMLGGTIEPKLILGFFAGTGTVYRSECVLER